MDKRLITEFNLKSGEKVFIRHIQPCDAADYVRFHLQITKETEYTSIAESEVCGNISLIRNMLEKFCRSQRAVFNVCIANGKIIGMCRLTPLSGIMKKHRCEMSIGVIKKYCGMGIGSLLTQITLGQADSFEQVELTVMESNSAAISLYEKYGFVQTGIIPNAFHLSGGKEENAILMVRDLRKTTEEK